MPFLLLLGLGVVTTLFLVAGILSVKHTANRRAAENAAAARANASALAQANKQIKKLGGTPVRTPAPPTPTVPPALAVHEIVSTAIVNAHLMVTYRNPAQTVDLGRVAGARGPRGKTGVSGKPAPTITPSPGRSGPAGRGITGALVTTDGHLLLSFTDDTTQDVGVVVGPAGADGKDGTNGVSVRNVAISDGHLMVTLSDGTTIEAGELPVGPPCPEGFSQVTVTPHPVESPGQTWVVCASN
jgi:hypothetical protein